MHTISVQLTPTIGAAALILFLFACLYDRYVAALEAEGLDRGYTALLVVAGTAIVLTGLAVAYSAEAALVALILFSAAGAPMTLGSIGRHQRQRRAEQLAAAAQIRQQLSETPNGHQANPWGLHLEEGD